MPRLSDTMESGTIARWLKQEGDEVKKGEIIAEIETDKANMEMEAYDSGVLARILVREGQSANLGDPIAYIAANAEEAQSLSSGAGDGAAAPAAQAGGATEGGQQAPQGTPAGEAPPGAQPSAGDAAPTGGEAAPEGATGAQPDGRTEPGERIKASPLARRMAQEHDIDLQQITGTGPGGRITKEDVQAFLKAGPQAAPAPAAQPAAPAQPAAQPAAPGGLRAPEPVEMSRMQQTIARRMTEARFSAPDFVLTSEIDMTDARALLRSLSSVEGAPKIGPNDLLIKAVAVALREHPDLNAGWENNGIVRYGRVNIGVAVAIPGGLVVPVVQDADQKSLGQIARESKALIEKARTNKLAPSEYEGGTFTISNLGMYGVDQFTPVINIPEACIMGVGGIIPKPVVYEGEIVVRERMRVTLSCDHRVSNGAVGAEFLQTLRRLLESPMLTIVQ